MQLPAEEKTIPVDVQSIFSDRTLCASPEPELFPRVSSVSCAAATQIRTAHDSYPVHALRTLRIKTRVVSAVALALWSTDLALALVEHFRMIDLQSPALQSRLLLVWAVCSGVFVLVAAVVFISTLLRRPHRPFLSFLRGLAIFMSATSSIIGFGVMFPVIAECSGDKCSGEERAIRLLVCLGVPVASVWTWVWIPTIRNFMPESLSP
ncbi:hypothetical protein C8R44DRAFT_377607 [Mycena epipterygia]|nr:hypothetical protein C8R44DRAFT_377607 [Mycena epipterygia]